MFTKQCHWAVVIERLVVGSGPTKIWLQKFNMSETFIAMEDPT